MRWLLLALCLGPLLSACAAVTPVVESALQAIAPVLVDALTNEIKSKYGSDAEPDPETAECMSHDGSALEDYPAEFEGRGWVICFVDRAKAD